MGNSSESDLTNIIRKIERKKILLPDFQREFVWKDEEQQKKIVASVLAKMPIGSVLLLKSKPDEYASKLIGCKNEIDTEQIDGEVEFLLDGQQRITVLTNVFSNVIHDQCSKISDLISPSLKRRFFLRIPKWEKCFKEQKKDIFGVKTLDFKYQNPDNEEPDFLSGDIYDFIECYTFLNNDKKPYNPQVLLSTSLDEFCMSISDGYLIPLFLMVPSENNRKQHMILRYGEIIHNVAEGLKKEIEDYFVQIMDVEKKARFIEEIFSDKEISANIKENYNNFSEEISLKAKVWEKSLEAYLNACVKHITLNKIVVSEEQRERAIDIYENLNRGGVSLDIFDLIMAKVAKVDKTNFYKRMIGYIKSNKQYTVKVVPDEIIGVVKDKIDTQLYNASISTKCYSEEKNEISSKYIDVFLDVLSLYCYNPNYEWNKYSIDDIKRNKILALAPEQIHENAEKVCIAIDRAMFFLQTRCGVRYIGEINYSLVLVVIAVVFIQDDWFNSKDVHRILEAWYWSSLFGGAYDKDQSSVAILHLQNMVKTLKEEQNKEWIYTLKKYIFDAQNFSDKEFVLMGKADEDRTPKGVLKDFICQYLLAGTYKDMFEDKTISVFCDEAKELEAHHIIPLGSIAKVGELTAKLRQDSKNICNSPLNFVYITKAANKEILEDPLPVYLEKITDEAKSALYLSAYSNANCSDSEIRQILESRYKLLKGNIKAKVDILLS